MKTILLYIETSANEISKAILPVISAGLNAKNQFKAEKLVGVLLGGPGVAAAADGIKNFGLDEVVTLESPVLAEYNAIDFSQALLQVCKEVSPSYVMAAASSRGKDFIPRVSAQLDIPQASDVIGFLENAGYRRPIFAGNIIAEVELEGDVHAVTVRTSAFDQPQKVDADSPSRMISATIEKTDLMEVVSFNTVKSERPELGAASVVVSGGRALKSKENFESVLFPLADSLNAAVGASRAAVDSGYAPNDWQVGQTGKIVAPKLYIAVGISGAVQHLAGMKDSKVIVAINKDPEAPIFEVADYGLVADLFEALPEMVKLINA